MPIDIRRLGYVGHERVDESVAVFLRHTLYSDDRTDDPGRYVQRLDPRLWMAFHQGVNHLWRVTPLSLADKLPARPGIFTIR